MVIYTYVRMRIPGYSMHTSGPSSSGILATISLPLGPELHSSSLCCREPLAICSIRRKTEENKHFTGKLPVLRRTRGEEMQSCFAFVQGRLVLSRPSLQVELRQNMFLVMKVTTMYVL